ncbi:MAG TPA: hypothetical protein VH082_12680 [Rudaea sp.]|jgi:hypothetical protein|nr:hypothetical protein [Rudaea sp.]
MRPSFTVRLRHAAGDAVLLFLLPCSIALLPWALGFRLLRRLARIPRLWRNAVEPAWNNAKPYLPNVDETEWKFEQRLLRLVDNTDSYLTLLRSDRWWTHHVDVIGEWPASGARVFLTYHWGAGHWIWRFLRTHGFDAGFVARRAEGRSLGMGRLSHAYAAYRGWAMRRIGSRGPLFVGAGKSALRDDLDAGASVVGMLDLPAASQQRAMELPLFGRNAVLPIGLARLAIDAGSPITLFSAGFDPQTGRRLLRIESLPNESSLDDIMRRYAAHLDARLRERPAFWQIWRDAPAIFVEARVDQAL